MTVSRNCDNTLQDSSRWKRANSRYKCHKSPKNSTTAEERLQQRCVTYNFHCSCIIYFNRTNDESKCHNFWIGFIGVVVLLHFMIWQLQYFLMNFEASTSVLPLGRWSEAIKVIALSPTLRALSSLANIFFVLVSDLNSRCFKSFLATDSNSTFQYIFEGWLS